MLPSLPRVGRSFASLTGVKIRIVAGLCCTSLVFPDVINKAAVRDAKQNRGTLCQRQAAVPTSDDFSPDLMEQVIGGLDSSRRRERLKARTAAYDLT
jgi:hypothetical protein